MDGKQGVWEKDSIPFQNETNLTSAMGSEHYQERTNGKNH